MNEAREPALPLFDHFPGLRRLPIAALGREVAPVQRLRALGKALGFDPWLKRDDLTVPAPGGGKVRRLELFLGEATAAGATAIITAGTAGSNHVAATAAHARARRLHAVCLLLHQTESPAVRANLLSAHANGAHLVACAGGTSLRRAAETVSGWMERLRAEGHRPHFIPFGGMGWLGVVASANAAVELSEQITDGELPCPSAIYLPTATASTAVGIALGLRACGRAVPIVAAQVGGLGGLAEDPRVEIVMLADEVCRRLRELDPAFPVTGLEPGDIQIRNESLGPGYGKLTVADVEAAGRLRRTEGVVLDDAYGAKAFALLLGDVARRTSGNVPLFWMTAAGPQHPPPGDERWRALPVEFHSYFARSPSPSPAGSPETARDSGRGAT